MSFFNAVYTLGGCSRTQPIQKDSEITIDFASQGTWARTIRWAKWVVTFPLTFTHGAYNTLSLMVSKDIQKVVARQIYSGNSINYMPFLMGKSGHVFTSQRAISVIGSYFRHDSKGPFERDQEEIFISILKDIFPEHEVDKEDFLFTCSRDSVKGLRKPFTQYIGPTALLRLRPQLTQVAEEVLDSMEDQQNISARYLAETYTVAILARLFLNHPGTLKELQNIGRAASSVIDYQFIKKWRKPDLSQSRQYSNDLKILRSAIELSKGEFRNELHNSGLSPIRVYGELLLVYAAGSETTSSALHYILWRLGQNPELQDKIRSESTTTLENFVNDCLQKYPPVGFFSRFASQDLIITVHNPEGESWQYPIAKGEALIIAPYLTETLPFGVGQHMCPGQWLARAEITDFILALLKRHVITSLPRKQELATVPGFGFPKLEPVELTFRKRT